MVEPPEDWPDEQPLFTVPDAWVAWELPAPTIENQARMLELVQRMIPSAHMPARRGAIVIPRTKWGGVASICPVPGQHWLVSGSNGVSEHCTTTEYLIKALVVTVGLPDDADERRRRVDAAFKPILATENDRLEARKVEVLLALNRSLRRERNRARYLARCLAHAYENGTRPLHRWITDALAFEVDQTSEEE